MKLKTINPDKYNVLSKTDLKDTLLRRDTKENQERFEASLTEYRTTRMTTTAVASLLTGVLYQRRPSLERLLGTPASFDHVLALGGAAGAFLSEDDRLAEIAEGIANTGQVPLLRSAGRKIGGLVS